MRRGGTCGLAAPLALGAGSRCGGGGGDSRVDLVLPLTTERRVARGRFWLAALLRLALSSRCRTHLPAFFTLLPRVFQVCLEFAGAENLRFAVSHALQVGCLAW